MFFREQHIKILTIMLYLRIDLWYCIHDYGNTLGNQSIEETGQHIIEKSKIMKRYRHIIILTALLLFAAFANAQNGEFINHKVTQGQTLFSISKMYDTTVEAIVKNNPESAKKLSIGQILRIPKQKADNNGTDEQDVVRDGKLYHTIRSKETLFSLGKRYGVTPDEICAANPGLSINNFPAGKKIVIPGQKVESQTAGTKKEPAYKFVPVKEEKTPEVATTHKVKRRETIEKICNNYGVSVEDFLKVNPELAGKEVKRKMVVNIPAKRSAKGEEKQTIFIAGTPDPEPEKETYDRFTDGATRIAVVLPFLLDRYAPEEQGRMVEFYQGFLMAVERLKREGHSLEVNTFDTGAKEKSLDSLISSGALDRMDLIIGAYYPNHNKELGRFVKDKDIPLVVPFSNKKDELYNNPMAFFVNTLQAAILPDVATNFVTTFPNANVIFVEDTIKSNKLDFIKTLTATLDKNGIPHTTVPMEQIAFNEMEKENDSEDEELVLPFTSLAVEGKENIIIPTSSSKETLNRILPSLVMANLLDTALMNDFKLFGYPEWQVYAQQAREQFYEVDTYFYATFFTHFSLPEAARFQNEFIRWYNRDMQKIYPRYGMLGYDIGYQFMLATMEYGRELPAKINELQFTPLQSGFKFERMDNNGGMMNKKLFFIHYTREYNIEKIDLDRCEE